MRQVSAGPGARAEAGGVRVAGAACTAQEHRRCGPHGHCIALPISSPTKRLLSLAALGVVAVQHGRLCSAVRTSAGAFPPRREQPLEMRDPARSITPGRVDFRG